MFRLTALVVVWSLCSFQLTELVLIISNFVMLCVVIRELRNNKHGVPLGHAFERRSFLLMSSYFLLL